MQHLQKTVGTQISIDGTRSERIATTEDSDHVGREGPLLHFSGTPNQPSDSPKACQWPGYITFSLDKDLESLPHAFRVDQRFELQPRFRAVRLGLTLIVEVRKFISLAEREQKGRL